jgi:hypothetical protein
MEIGQLESLALRAALFLVFGVGVVRYLVHELRPEIRALRRKWQERQKPKA